MLIPNAVKLSFVKDAKADNPEPRYPTIEIEQIEEITRRSVLDVTKLGVAAIGSLMILRTTLNIVEHHSTK